MLFGETAHAFLLAFPALFSIINPVAGALIFREATADRTHAERIRLAGRVGLNSLVVMLVALWAGSYVLAFFSISLQALRIAGGLVVALFAWGMLNAPEHGEAHKQKQAAPATEEGAEDIAFFPLTLPVTTGPGTISVAVTLGSEHPEGAAALLFFAGISAAAVAMAAVIWVSYRSADRIAGWLGENGRRTLTRLSAFLLLCIGVQILITGVTEVLGPLLGH